uniref:Uncharacterized protein n=1 Tax=Palpitomonas bilix TaxID=652834 RepID=A0A7S3G1P5_9EUKA
MVSHKHATLLLRRDQKTEVHENPEVESLRIQGSGSFYVVKKILSRECRVQQSVLARLTRRNALLGSPRKGRKQKESQNRMLLKPLIFCVLYKREDKKSKAVISKKVKELHRLRLFHFFVCSSLVCLSCSNARVQN